MIKKLIKALVISLYSLIGVIYLLDLYQYKDYPNYIIQTVDHHGVLLSPTTIHPNAVYQPEEKMLFHHDLKVDGFGILRLFIHNTTDLNPSQRAKINIKDNEVEEIIVYWYWPF